MTTTWNPADCYGSPARLTFSNGDLTVAGTAGYWAGSYWQSVRATDAKSSGKWAFQVKPDIIVDNNVHVISGLMTAGPNITDDPGAYPGSTSTSIGAYGTTGDIYRSDGVVGSLSRIQGRNPLAVAVDYDAGLVWFAYCESSGSCLLPQAAPIIISNNLLTVNIQGYAAGEWRGSRSNTVRSAGLLYCECTPSASSTTVFGLCNSTQSMTANNTIGQGGTEGVSYKSDGTTVNCGGISMSAWGTNTIGMAVNLTTGKVWFYDPATGYWNGNASYDPAAGTGGIDLATQTVTGPYYAAIKCYTANEQTINFGDTAFAHTVPAGFSAWDNIGNPILWNGDILANQDPATGTGGLDISGFGAESYPVCSTQDPNTQTGNFKNSPAFGFPIPSGFSAWDGGSGGGGGRPALMFIGLG